MVPDQLPLRPEEHHLLQLQLRHVDFQVAGRIREVAPRALSDGALAVLWMAHCTVGAKAKATVGAW